MADTPQADVVADPKAWVYLVVWQTPLALSEDAAGVVDVHLPTVRSITVQAPTPEAALQALLDQVAAEPMGLPAFEEGTLAWVVPVQGVHAFEYTGKPPTGADGKPLVYYPQVLCPTCKGTGGRVGKACRRCAGTGKVARPGAEAIELRAVAPVWVRQSRGGLPPTRRWPGERGW